MAQIELSVQARTVTGKQVKSLRKEGQVPMVVYGYKTEPINLQGPEFDTRRAVAKAGGQLMSLHIDGEDEPRMTLAWEVQRDTITGKVLHVDFYEVDITERIEVEVPLSLVGEPRMVNTGLAVLVHVLNEVEIECLPLDIMQTIEVDVSKLVTLDDEIHVKDLVVPDNVKILTPGDELVAKLEPVEEEEEEEVEEVAEAPSVEDVEVIQRGKVEEEIGDEEK
jgi:large subunit ribosomal protein L25